MKNVMYGCIAFLCITLACCAMSLTKSKKANKVSVEIGPYRIEKCIYNDDDVVRKARGMRYQISNACLESTSRDKTEREIWDKTNAFQRDLARIVYNNLAEQMLELDSIYGEYYDSDNYTFVKGQRPKECLDLQTGCSVKEDIRKEDIENKKNYLEQTDLTLAHSEDNGYNWYK